MQLSEDQARTELLSSKQRLQATIDPDKHHIGDQLAGMSMSILMVFLLHLGGLPNQVWPAMCLQYQPGTFHVLFFSVTATSKEPPKERSCACFV